MNSDDTTSTSDPYANLLVTGYDDSDIKYLNLRDLINAGYISSGKIKIVVGGGKILYGKLKGGSLHYEHLDESGKVLWSVTEPVPGTFIRKIGAKLGLDEKDYKTKSWNSIYVNGESLFRIKNRYAQDIHISDTFRKELKTIKYQDKPCVQGIFLDAEYKGKYLIHIGTEDVDAVIDQNPILKHPKVVVKYHKPIEYTLESFLSIGELGGRMPGTLGAVVEDIDHPSRPKYGLTAGHVLTEESFPIYHHHQSKEDDKVMLQSPEVIRGNADWALFSLENVPLKYVDRIPILPYVDFTAAPLYDEREQLQEEEQKQKQEEDDDASVLTADLGVELIRNDPLNIPDNGFFIGKTVFKMGSKTGLTVGKVSRYDDSSKCFVVEPIGNKDFSDNGDSGSLYFYDYNTSLIPFAIHVKGNKEERISHGLSLKKIFKDIALEVKGKFVFATKAT